MTDDQTLTEITTRVLTSMERVLARSAARRRARPRRHDDEHVGGAGGVLPQIPVGHVEAGLRTQRPVAAVPRRDEPAADRHDRVLSLLADLARARASCSAKTSPPATSSSPGTPSSTRFLETARRDGPARCRRAGTRLDPSRPIVVVTAHRRENHEFMRDDGRGDARDREMPAGVRSFIGRSIRRRESRRSPTRCSTASRASILVDPIDYAQMVCAVRESAFVLTDSGGLQEEAPCLGKPVLGDARGDRAARRRSRPEPSSWSGTGANGSSPRPAPADDSAHYARMSRAVNPYGDGQRGRADRRVAARAPARRQLPGALRRSRPPAGGRRRRRERASSRCWRPAEPLRRRRCSGCSPESGSVARRGQPLLGARRPGRRALVLGGYSAVRLLCARSSASWRQDNAPTRRSYSDAEAAADLATYHRAQTIGRRFGVSARRRSLSACSSSAGSRIRFSRLWTGGLCGVAQHPVGRCAAASGCWTNRGVGGLRLK